jgi:hypothetical protein
LGNIVPGVLDAPVDSAELAPMVGRLGLALDQRATLETLQADQRAAFDAEVPPLNEAVVKILHQGEDGEGAEGIPEGLATLRCDAYRRLRAKRREIEEAFFAAAAVVVPAERSDALAVWHIAHRLGDPARLVAAFEDSWELDLPLAERSINVAQVVLEGDLAPSDRSVAERIVAAHGEALLAARERLLDAGLAFYEAAMDTALHQMVAERRNVDVQTDSSVRAAGRHRVETLEALEAAAVAATQPTTDVCAELEAALPAAAWRTLHLAIRKSVYPGIDGERPTMVRLFERVAKLRLDPAQAARLAEVRHTWEVEFDRQTDRLAELGTQPVPGPDGTTMPYERFRLEEQWTEFRRGAASDQARHAVARLLKPEERRTIPGLPSL